MIPCNAVGTPYNQGDRSVNWTGAVGTVGCVADSNCRWACDCCRWAPWRRPIPRARSRAHTTLLEPATAAYSNAHPVGVLCTYVRTKRTTTVRSRKKPKHSALWLSSHVWADRSRACDSRATRTYPP